ncbi:response regulator [Actinokineospora inagensis]|uniref:response regulator n=1 Tax=Actinokineospora inagensis TaxID=103730 RepID=UPI000418645E|nr:response regulator [Actinokineospora inagensis]
MARVLVVDDDADVRDLVVRWLREDGHEVLPVDSGPLALAAVDSAGLPDLVVLDVAMPGMDGVDLLRQLREIDQRLPAIFLTVLWSGPDVERMAAMAAVYVVKPSSGDALRAAVRDLLADRGRVGPR